MSRYFDEQAHTWDKDPMKIDRAKAAAACFTDVVLQSRKNLLDFGGGTGTLALYLSDLFEQITVADSSAPMLGVAEEKIKSAGIKNIQTLLIRESLAEVSQTYSAIATLMTLHHLPNLDHFFKSAANILTSHGSLIIMDLYKEDGAFHSHVKDFEGHNGFEIEELSEQLQKNGFRICQVKKFFEIEKEISPDHKKIYPLFFLQAETTQ